MSEKPLRYALLAGVAYFVAMAGAHFFGVKQPLLFVYYDTPFYAYQDKIISFAVIAYAALFWCAARNRSVVPAALFVLAVTVGGLSAVNVSEALADVLRPGQATWPYWVQTGLIAAYFVWLLALYLRQGTRRAETSNSS